MIFFTAYSSANFKLEFVQQAFKTRKQDIDFNPGVFKKGYIFDDKMVKKLKDYSEPSSLKKTTNMFLIEMFDSPIGIINGIISKLGF